MKAWHFVADTLRDGSPVPEDGVVLRHVGPLVLCRSGFHWSKHPFDALQYAPGNTLCLVEYGDEVIYDYDKGCSRERTIIARMDAEPLLYYFAKQQALSVIHLWDAPQVVLDYLMGDGAARAAARAAARNAAEAAREAARDAARAAARAAARNAAEAARAAAWDAAGAAWAAAWDAARNAAGAAAWAAWAARAALQNKQRQQFLSLVEEAFERS